MSVRHKIRKIVTELDKYSPVPLFYEFVMSEDEKRLFDENVKDAEQYLEFGLGGSTFEVLRKSKAKVYSIDSSQEWISRMRQYQFVKRSEQKQKRLNIFHVDIGKTGDWGFPEGEASREDFPEYSQDIFHKIRKDIIDTVLIDGRFRVACTLRTILECHSNPRLKILIHDFWNRPHYHVVLKYLDVIDRADTLGVFTVKDNINFYELQKEYEEYKFNPA